MEDKEQGHQLEGSLSQPFGVEEALCEAHRRRKWKDGGFKKTLEGGINRLNYFWREECSPVPWFLASTRSNPSLDTTSGVQERICAGDTFGVRNDHTKAMESQLGELITTGLKV